jgi:HEAT repeat protein
MTRHEAAEALGAIQKPESLKILRFYMDPSNESEEVIRQTCELAIRKIETDDADEPQRCSFSFNFLVYILVLILHHQPLTVMG